MKTKKSVEEKLRIIDDMEEFLKIALDTDDVQIIVDIDLFGDTDESIQKAAST